MERSTLSWACQTAGPLRRPDVQTRPTQAQTRASTPSIQLPDLVQGKQRGLPEKVWWHVPAAGGLSQSIWKQLQSSIFITLLDRFAKPETMSVTRSMIPEHTLWVGPCAGHQGDTKKKRKSLLGEPERQSVYLNTV